MAMAVDDARRQHQTGGVELYPATPAFQIAHRHNPVARDRQIALGRRAAGAVDHPGAAQDQIGLAHPSRSFFKSPVSPAQRAAR